MPFVACPGCHRVLPVRPGLTALITVAHVRRALVPDDIDHVVRWVPCSEVTDLAMTTGSAFRGLAMDSLLGLGDGPSSPVRWDLPADELGPQRPCPACGGDYAPGCGHIYHCPGRVGNNSCGYCGSTAGYDTTYDGWPRCVDCDGC